MFIHMTTKVIIVDGFNQLYHITLLLSQSDKYHLLIYQNTDFDHNLLISKYIKYIAPITFINTTQLLTDMELRQCPIITNNSKFILDDKFNFKFSTMILLSEHRNTDKPCIKSYTSNGSIIYDIDINIMDNRQILNTLKSIL